MDQRKSQSHKFLETESKLRERKKNNNNIFFYSLVLKLNPKHPLLKTRLIAGFSVTKYRCVSAIFCDALNQELLILTLNNVTLRKAIVCQHTEFLLLRFVFVFFCIFFFVSFFLPVHMLCFFFPFYVKIFAFQGIVPQCYLTTSHPSLDFDTT